MDFEKQQTPTPEEMAEIEKQRSLSDAELLKGGAEYKFDEKGEKKLDVTRGQVEEAKDEMIDSKIQSLTNEEAHLFMVEQESYKALQTVDSLMYEGKIDKKTHDDLFGKIESLRECSKIPFIESLGTERAEEVSGLYEDNFRRNVKREVAETKNFEDLFTVINRSGRTHGTKESYAPDQLKDIINDVRSGKRPITDVTRTDGLRRQVDQLMTQEKVGNIRENISRKF